MTFDKFRPKLIMINAAEWWKSDVQTVLSEFLSNGGGPNVSDAFLINGQPGDLYPCSKPGIVTINLILSLYYFRLYVFAGVSKQNNTQNFCPSIWLNGKIYQSTTVKNWKHRFFRIWKSLD